ncbi:MAG TPA: GNAT family N-acetyltransferase [Pseudogracilibacillus sp.]|nr:GNAT family N-acetyltransferase [Pseudogracilibacillus sp.]
MITKIIKSEEELKTAFAIRNKVFIQEQEVPTEEEYDEFDTLDGPCKHVLVYYNNEAVGTGRIRWIEDIGKLERICVLEPFRSFGLGKAIITALEKIAIEKEVVNVKLHSQTQVEAFYTKLGYHTSSDVFMEASIPHVLMTKRLPI